MAWKSGQFGLGGSDSPEDRQVAQDPEATLFSRDARPVVTPDPELADHLKFSECLPSDLGIEIVPHRNVSVFRVVFREASTWASLSFA